VGNPLVMIRDLLQMRRRARRFGLDFQRRATFVLPTHLRVGGGIVELASPREHGAWSDFVSIFIEDTYHLEQWRGVNTVLDIGANIGLLALAARNYYPKATIHCYEPNPELRRFLDTNCDSIGTVLYPEGVGSQSGKIDLEIRGDSNQSRSTQSETGSIVCVSLRNAVERLGGSVDLAKIDCEGAEWEMLSDPEAWVGIRNVAMEYHLFGTEEHDDIAPTMEKCGFKVLDQVRSHDFGMVWASRIN
jgi:FkbM family methyltransferase